MALTAPQIVTVAEIIRETLSYTTTLAADLTSDQVTSIQDDIDTWSGIRDKHLIVKGGKDGIDLNNERKREAIRQRIRKQLGLSLISDEALALDPNAMSLFEINVGTEYL